MPFTPDMRRKVDQIRDYLYGGGYPDPLSNAEQLSFLFFFYMIEGIDAANLRQAKATRRDYASLFAGEWTLRNPLNAPARGIETIPRDRIRWSSWANAMTGDRQQCLDECSRQISERGESNQRRNRNLPLAVKRDAHPKTEFRVVLKQRVGPGRTPAFSIDSPRRGRKVSSVDR